MFVTSRVMNMNLIHHEMGSSYGICLSKLSMFLSSVLVRNRVNTLEALGENKLNCQVGVWALLTDDEDYDDEERGKIGR